MNHELYTLNPQTSSMNPKQERLPKRDPVMTTRTSKLQIDPRIILGNKVNHTRIQSLRFRGPPNHPRKQGSQRHSGFRDGQLGDGVEGCTLTDEAQGCPPPHDDGAILGSTVREHARV